MTRTDTLAYSVDVQTALDHARRGNQHGEDSRRVHDIVSERWW